MKKSILITLALMAVLIPYAATSATVTRIIDGDTLEAREDGEVVRVRLVDIDAPEKSQAYGQRAKQKLIELVKGADDFTVKSTSKDRYGRVLGQVYVKRCQPECLSYYVNAEMVKSGLAWAYRFHNKATSPAMAELETEARKKKIGLWADPNAIEPWHYRQREKMLSN